ncbi:MAG: hypothetical protein LV480_12060 [Methylacidiphilales bacterium]|nr:hypothetical protein [Candidatus Methylacidiphilales bacterium]
MSVESFVRGIPRSYLRAKLALIVSFRLGAMVLPLALAAQDISTPDVDEEKIDSSGLIWAAKHYRNQLYTYDGQNWKPAASGLAPEASAEFRGMATMADGAVVVVWVVQGEGLAVTRHLGSSSTLLGSERGDKQSIPNLIRPTIDSKGRIWMSGCFPRIYRTDGKGGVTVVHEFAPEDFRSREKKRMLTSDLYNPIHCEEDGLGRTWIWSGTTGSVINQWGKNPNLDSSPSLHGIYLISEDKVELHDDLGPIKDGDFYSVARFDNRHMIISDSENGVYKIDIESWKTQNMPGSTPLELRNVHELFVDGSDLYAFDEFPGTNLWRWSNDQWNEVVTNFETSTNGIGFSPRTWLRAKSGMIITASDHEAWFVPHTGHARVLSWKSAFPAIPIKAIVQLKNGKFCVLGTESATVSDTQISYCELPDLTNELSSHRIVEVEPDVAWLTSQHIWMIPKQDSTVLKEWDGKNWLVHPIPNKGRGGVGLNEDDQGRIWVYDGTANLFDPVKNQWQSFSNLDDCFAATMGHPVHFQHLWGSAPRYSSDKQRIAYDNWYGVHFYNGSIWRLFRASDITGWPGDGFFNPPWFDAKGTLCVSNQANSITWQYEEDGKWASVPYVAHPSDPYDLPEKPKFTASDLQKAIAARFANTVHADNLGGYWCTGAGNLYRCIGDQWVSIFAPGEVTPFNSNPSLLGVDVDSRGNVFINVFAGETRRYLILAKRPAPQTTIALKQVDEDSFVATFDPHSDGAVKFRWQLDDNEWNATESPTITLHHLTNGPHTIRAVAIDDQLNMDASPAVAHCEIKIDANKQIASLIAQLTSPDYDLRKEAVQILASEPKLSQPALLKAKTTATEDQIWWIESTLQEIENEKASKTGH